MTSIPIAAWQRRRLVDAAIDAYVDWREERGAVWDAYGSWKAAPSADCALAFGAYAAALDREERASEVYARLIRRVGDLVKPESHAVADRVASSTARRWAA
jgi:hypothetical protein